MRIPTGAVLLFFSNDSAGPCSIEGVVESSETGCAVVATGQGVSAIATPGGRCEVRFTDDHDGRYKGVHCKIESVEDGRITLNPQGDAFSANQRESFRVFVSQSEIEVWINGDEPGAIVDVSETGLRVCVPGTMSQGETAHVRVRSADRVIQGVFTVRRVEDSRVGSCVGLSADPFDKELAAGLRAMVADMQRAQLRRRSRVAGTRRVTTDPVEPKTSAHNHAGSRTTRTNDDPAWVRVPASALAGEALPGSLRREDGQVVASRGEILSIDELSRLGDGGLIACEDWNETRRASRRPDSDRRSCGRSECEGVVRVIVQQGNQVLRLRGRLVDISRGGLGLRTPTLLEQGTRVVVDFSTADRPCWIMGRVVHGQVGHGETSCRLGVRFAQTAVQTTPVPDGAHEFTDWSIADRPGRKAV